MAESLKPMKVWWSEVRSDFCFTMFKLSAVALVYFIFCTRALALAISCLLGD